MAAAVVYNTDMFGDSSGKNPLLREAVSGATCVYVLKEVPSTSVNDVADVWVHFAVPEGREIILLGHHAEDLDTHATPALDADIVLRVYDSAGAATDTILFNAGTAFQAAQATLVFTPINNVKVEGSAGGHGLICLKTNTAAATAAAGDLGIFLVYR